MDQKTCPVCGGSIEGRSDKRFCSVYCRSAWHYQQKKEEGMSVYRSIQTQLRQNRQILKSYNKAGKTVVPAFLLEAAGFDARYFTHQYVSKAGTEYRFCYEYAFRRIRVKGTDLYDLSQWQPFKDLRLRMKSD